MFEDLSLARSDLIYGAHICILSPESGKWKARKGNKHHVSYLKEWTKFSIPGTTKMKEQGLHCQDRQDGWQADAVSSVVESIIRRILRDSTALTRVEVGLTPISGSRWRA